MGTADSLKRAADLLYAVWFDDLQTMLSRSLDVDAPPPPSSVASVAMLLGAFALENVLKGLLVCRDPSLVQAVPTDPDRLISGVLQSHNLRELSERARVQLSAQEESLLARLTEFLLWAGRYPGPLRASHSAPRPLAEHGGASFRSEHFDQLSTIFKRLFDQLWAETIAVQREREG